MKKKNVGKIIQCPYHSWTYDLDGNLKVSPHFGGTNKHKPQGFNNSEHGLKPIRIHIWHDWIFINLNGKAKKFEEYAKPLIRKFKIENPDRPNKSIVYPYALFLLILFGYTNFKFGKRKPLEKNLS